MVTERLPGACDAQPTQQTASDAEDAAVASDNGSSTQQEQQPAPTTAKLLQLQFIKSALAVNRCTVCSVEMNVLFVSLLLKSIVFYRSKQLSLTEIKRKAETFRFWWLWVTETMHETGQWFQLPELLDQQGTPSCQIFVLTNDHHFKYIWFSYDILPYMS